MQQNPDFSRVVEALNNTIGLELELPASASELDILEALGQHRRTDKDFIDQLRDGDVPWAKWDPGKGVLTIELINPIPLGTTEVTHVDMHLASTADVLSTDGFGPNEHVRRALALVARLTRWTDTRVGQLSPPDSNRMVAVLPFLQAGRRRTCGS
jgi:hypothetical protein